MADFHWYDGGSIIVLTPKTDAGIEWIGDHLPEDHMVVGEHGVAIERRYFYDIYGGIQLDGLEITP